MFWSFRSPEEIAHEYMHDPYLQWALASLCSGPGAGPDNQLTCPLTSGLKYTGGIEPVICKPPARLCGLSCGNCPCHGYFVQVTNVYR